MSTSPIGPGTSSALATVAPAAAKAAKKSPLAVLLGLGAVGLAGWMVKDSYQGSQPIWDQKYEGIKEHAEWEDMTYGMGHYSGNPGMDDWAHKFKRLTLFGPMGLVMAYGRFKTYVGGLINDVIMPNLLPIAAGIGGIYYALGKNAIHGPLKKMWSIIGPHLAFRPSFKWVDRMMEAAARGIVKVAKFAVNNPLLALLLVTMGGFTVKRFDDSYGHEGQHDFFRDSINTKGH